MDISLTAAFWAVSMVFVLTPGVDWAYAISSGLRRGGVIPAVTGMLTGHLAATLIVAGGVAAVVTASEVAMLVLTGLGALYLIWLGIAALRHPAVPDLDGQSAPAGSVRLFAKGLGISLLNPKVFLLFLALLPQFTSQSASLSEGIQMIGLGLVHIANCALVYLAVSAGAGTVLRKRPRAAVIVGMISGIVMIALGSILLIEKVIEVIGP